jgi:hypothetical protein
MLADILAANDDYDIREMIVLSLGDELEVLIKLALNTKTPWN